MVNEMHYQENTLLTLTQGQGGQGHTKYQPVPSTSCDYAPPNFDVATFHC